MSKTSTYPLRLPQSLKNQLVKLAKRDGTSVNQFINIAVAEKISALDTTEFFAKRAENADLEAFRKILFRSGGETPAPDDEITQ
ncbi:MAG TPA: toxin-antitoxin system HicB family antitoxin [Gammaproteobacteria bacterium]|nr:toxin-antitoxin system HicB family antitoxin [Gammaproteobacteria bacterium]